ncbi:hypothetical protein F4777DRAFT_14816 [Nemania sp. FL0916]|nr:hypothetical protein F4777DRAFT_14816 [Nemania sp. FL0916]
MSRSANPKATNIPNPTRQANTINKTSTTRNAPSPPPSLPYKPTPQPLPRPPIRRPGPTIPAAARVDLSSKEYKHAASKFTRVMIALPILLVTSYYLFDRLALGHEAKSLERYRAPSSDGEGEGVAKEKEWKEGFSG